MPSLAKCSAPKSNSRKPRIPRSFQGLSLTRHSFLRSDKVGRTEDSHLPYYLAQPYCDLVVEMEKSFSLSSEELINYSRPSIDLQFETASDPRKQALVHPSVRGKFGRGGMTALDTAMSGIHHRTGCIMRRNPRKCQNPPF